MYIDLSKIPDFLQIGEKDRIMEIIHVKAEEIRQYFQRSGFGKAVIVVSAGIDSAVSAALSVRALGEENVIAVRMPFKTTNDASLAVAQKVCEAIGLPTANMLTVEITRAVMASWEALKHIPGGVESLRIGNMAARERMKVLMDIAACYDALLMGTENRSEEHLAYFTIGGDQISSVEPIRNLWKTQVYQLATGLPLPDSVKDRAPSAELWSGQTDESELGVSYLEIDTILAGREAGLSQAELQAKYGVSERVYTKVVDHVERVAGKREAPYELKG